MYLAKDKVCKLTLPSVNGSTFLQPSHPSFDERAQHGVHADGWILTAKIALFVTLGFVRFGSESRPASRP